MFRVLLTVMLVLPASVHADLYQWTDENGVKHFSNTPPEHHTETMRQMKEVVGSDRKDVDRLQKTILPNHCQTTSRELGFGLTFSDD